MLDGKDAEITNRIGNILLDILPADFDKIVARSEVGDDWAETKLRFEDASGNVGHFSLRDAPRTAIGDINEGIMELREAFSTGGGEAWNRATFTARRDGKFDVEFAYEGDHPS
jgi:hypothetical protein